MKVNMALKTTMLFPRCPDRFRLAAPWALRPPALACALLLGMLSGCAVHAPYVAPVLTEAAFVPDTWSQAGTPAVGNLDGQWWQALHDPALTTLLKSAQQTSPGVQQALARVAEARALLAGNAAATTPTMRATLGAGEAKGASQAPRAILASASAAATLSWEADLFGRIGYGVASAKASLAAREQDATYAQLVLTTDIANAVLTWRACNNSVDTLQDEVKSRKASLQAIEQKLAVGMSNQVDQARSRAAWLSARANLAGQQEQCARQVNALVSLSGQTRAMVLQHLSQPHTGPELPELAADLPATLLAQHPSLIAAERDALAAWQEIGAAKAARWPRLDLSAMLGQQWLRVAGINSQLTPWSIAANLGVNVFDGGAGAANVSLREARYQQALINFQRVLRSTVQEVENALAFDSAARARLALNAQAQQAAQTALLAAEAQWQAGAISLFELEDAKRGWYSAQNQTINARRDLALAWVGLIKASATRVGTHSGTNVGTVPAAALSKD
jgi:NodT family efflux transporter outer membrane factor (OMF) lipoprotein